MQNIAAIDIGSNAIRLVIGRVDEHGDIQALKKAREPVRLGKDAFGEGAISPKTVAKALAVFKKFSAMLKECDVRRYRAVGTAALREAKNREFFVQQAKAASGLSIDVIDGAEEAGLIFSAVSHRVNLADKTALLIDIGGGSVELTVSVSGRARASQTFKLGAVRLLQLMADRGWKERQLRDHLGRAMADAQAFLAEALRGEEVDLCIGTGGNFECLGKLRVALLHRNSIFSMTRDELSQLIEHLIGMSIKERVQFLRLRPDRADVVVPAALVTQEVMRMARSEVLFVPYVGLRDGLMAELAAQPEASSGTSARA
jgi:exopolyphosphatase/guanosine-5'-triphosphate,3'-diphosphate pyrophosphatase